VDDKTDPLDYAHDEVDGSACVGSAEFADEVVELATCGADAEEEGNFDEENYEGAGQADTAKDDEQWSSEVEDIRNAEREAQNHAHDAGPVSTPSANHPSTTQMS